MNFVRFMGEGEMEAYLNGKVLRNETNWKGIGKTDSQGFCFFPDTPAPEERLHYLSGVVDFDVVAVFATKGPIMLRKCSGSYRDPNEKLPGNLTEALFAPPKMIQVDEYSISAYLMTKGADISNDMQVLTTAIIIAGALAGGDK